MNCVELKLIKYCDDCAGPYTHECFVDGYRKWITEEGIVISLAHIKKYPENSLYFLTAVKLYYPQYLYRIEKLMLFI